MINQKFQVEESPLFIPLKSLKNINLGSWVVNTYQNYGWYNVQIYIYYQTNYQIDHLDHDSQFHLPHRKAVD